MRKLIIYEESCPMCKVYTKGMVAADTSGCLTRIGSGQLTQDTIDRLDLQRIRHEIPLVDLDGGETLYGVDTWIFAVGQRNKETESLLSMRWFKATLQKLYAFISYNRRIIITSAPGRWQLFVQIGYALMIGQHFIRTYWLSLNPWLSVCFTVLFILLIKF